MRSMFSAVAGLKVHQIMLDVVANTIANVNTIGYKGQRTSFKDSLSQVQRGAGAPGAQLGGTNAMQVGLGVQLNSIDNLMQSGAIQNTGGAFDAAIQGDGMFRVATHDGTAFGEYFYTRAGNFTRDSAGYLVTQEGYYVVGYNVDATTGLPGTTEQRIQIPTDAKSVSIGQNGVVTVIDAAGATLYPGAITLSKFPNDAGLDRVSSNRWRESANSGAPTNDVPGANGLGTLIPGAVEMSNVDLAQEFTSMITAQRGFQANGRIISTADEMLQELVNLKR
jgi:flagellar hook protein FlgE